MKIFLFISSMSPRYQAMVCEKGTSMIGEVEETSGTSFDILMMKVRSNVV
jgi:hypothetical protein